MEKNFDANIPDTTNGDFFCRLCLISANSEGMWKSHIAGKRHLKTMGKYPNGLPRGYIAEEDDESYDAPLPKYGRYENEDWGSYPPMEPDIYPRNNWDYVPEVRPQITIDYGHKKTLPEAETLMNETIKNTPFSLRGASSKENFEDPIIKILADSKFILNKFEEESSKFKAGGSKSALDSRNKNALRDDDFEKELDELLGKSDSKQNDPNSFSADGFKKQISDILLGKSKSVSNERDAKPANNKDSQSNNDRKIPSKANSSDKRNLEKDSNKDTRKNDRNIDRDRRYERDSGKDRRYTRDSDRDKKKYDKDDKNKKKSDRDRGRSYRYSNRRKRSRSSSSSSSSSSSDSRSSSSSDSSDSDRRRNKSSDKKVPPKEPPKKTIVDKDLLKRITAKTDDSIFLDAFHKLNDKKLFDVPDTEEPTSSSSWKKTTKVEAKNIDSIDPDKLTTDNLDDLLSSYLKNKSNPSVEKGPDEKTTPKTATVNKPDSVETIAEKLETLPTKSFFQMVLKKLEMKNLIKDGDELKMLLKIISKAQEVVAQNLPSSVQAMLKSKMGANDSKTTPVSVHSPVLSTNYATAAIAVASPQIPSAVVQAISQPAVPTVIQPNAGIQGMTQPAVPTVMQPNAGVQAITQPAVPTVMQPNVGVQAITQPAVSTVIQPILQPSPQAVVQPVLQPVVHAAQPVMQALTQPSLPPEVRQLLPSQFLQAVSQAIAQSARSQVVQTSAPTVPTAVPKSIPQPSSPSVATSVYASQAVTKSTSRHLSPSGPRKPPESSPSQASKCAPQKNSESSPAPKLDSFEKVIAWQNYLASMQGASKDAPLTTANSVHAYQNYLKSLESSKQKAAGAGTVSNMVPNNPISSKATLPESTKKIANAQPASLTASLSTSAKPPPVAENSGKDRVSFEKFLSTIHSASKETTSPSPAPNSSVNQSAVRHNTPVSQTKPTEPVSGSSPAPMQNQNAWQSNQKNNFANFCSQMYSLLMNNPRMLAPNAPMPTAQTVSTQPSPVSQSVTSSTSQPSALNSSSVSQPSSVPQPPSRASPVSQPPSRSSPAPQPSFSKSSPAPQPSSRSSPSSQSPSSKSSSESPRYASRPSSESSRFPPRPPFDSSRYGPRPPLFKPNSLRQREQNRYSSKYSSRR